MKSIRLVRALVLLPLVFVAACGAHPTRLATFPRSTPGRYLGAIPSTPIPAPAVTLTDTDGHPFPLRARLTGHVTLVYFGYTHCPDVCPQTMAELAQVLRRLPTATSRTVQVVFITSDPVHDTARAIRVFLNQFDPHFIGLTGSLAAVSAAGNALGVPIGVPVRAANGTYNVDHGAAVLAFSGDSAARVEYLPGNTVADYLHDLPLLSHPES